MEFGENPKWLWTEKFVRPHPEQHCEGGHITPRWLGDMASQQPFRWAVNLGQQMIGN